MSPRQICHRLEYPTGSSSAQFEIYTYDTKNTAAVPYEAMGEKVFFDFTGDCVRMSTHLTPEQARHLSLYLASVADACEANRARHAAARIPQSTPELTP